MPTKTPARPDRWYVYILYREDGVTPFYVGLGTKCRWLEHERKAPTEVSHKAAIIRQILAKFIKVPKRKIATGLTRAEAIALEVKTIAEIGREPKGPLVNITIGGECGPPPGKVKHRPETIEKYRAAAKKRCQDPAYMAKLRANVKRQMASPEARARLSAKLKLQIADTDFQARSKAAKTATPISIQTRLKMSASAIARRVRVSPTQGKLPI